ncbi:hypothetical protein DKE62_14825 [Listeria monocytogenes]|nr:hypothetical protein [Listeria monocytogenes]
MILMKMENNMKKQAYLFEYSQEEDMVYSQLNPHYQRVAQIPFHYEPYIGLQCTGYLRFWKWDEESLPSPLFFEENMKHPHESADGWELLLPFRALPEKESLTTIIRTLMERLAITYVRIRKDEPCAGTAHMVLVNGELFIGDYLYTEDALIYKEMTEELKFVELA